MEHVLIGIISLILNGTHLGIVKSEQNMRNSQLNMEKKKYQV